MAIKSPAQTNAVNKYIKNNMRRFTLQCHNETEADIIEFLEAADNYNAIIKSLIRKAIQDEKNNNK